MNRITKYCLTTLFLLVLIQMSTGFTQNYYWVFFNDKPSFSDVATSIQPDFFDTPIATDYLSIVHELARDTIGSSFWLNAVMLGATTKNILEITDLPFVKQVLPIQESEGILCQLDDSNNTHFENTRRIQVESLGLSRLTELGATGKGLRIAIFDGGFPGVDTHEAFRHLFDNNRIIKTWNFPEGTADVYRNISHGTSVLSCISGYYNNLPTGLASEAEFLLARTELRTEPWKEQLYWIQAAEWAHANGANIITSSLGYTSHHYFPEEMDGSSPIAEVARIAFNKGILVINSYGNEGTSDWKTGGTPADAAEVLSIGALDPVTGLKLDFSSIGPAQNWILKPNVSAAGKVLVANSRGWKVAFGTSFSAPLITGYAACLWELYPDASNADIFELIQKTGSLYPYYDYAHGYGIPSAIRLNQPDPVIYNQLNYIPQADLILVDIPDHDTQPHPLLYYHFSDPEGRIVEYGVTDREEATSISIEIPENRNFTILRIRYANYFSEIPMTDE